MTCVLYLLYSVSKWILLSSLYLYISISFHICPFHLYITKFLCHLITSCFCLWLEEGRSLFLWQKLLPSLYVSHDTVPVSLISLIFFCISLGKGRRRGGLDGLGRAGWRLGWRQVTDCLHTTLFHTHCTVVGGGWNEGRWCILTVLACPILWWPPVSAAVSSGPPYLASCL